MIAWFVVVKNGLITVLTRIVATDGRNGVGGTGDAEVVHVAFARRARLGDGENLEVDSACRA